MLTLFGKKVINLNTVVTTLVATVITVGAGILVTRLTGPVPISVSQTTTQKETSFSVTGEAELVAVPDEANVSMGVEVTRPTVAGAQDEVNQVINTIADQLKDLGIKKEDIKTENYNIYPNYSFRGENNQVDGYRVSTQLRVKVTDFEKLNQAIDLATAAGANQISGVTFGLSEKKQDELTKQAREEAISDAKDSAQELARLAGLKLGKVIDVQEYSSGYPQPLYRATNEALALDAEGGEPTQIEPGTTTFNYSVSLSFETL